MLFSDERGAWCSQAPPVPQLQLQLDLSDRIAGNPPLSPESFVSASVQPEKLAHLSSGPVVFLSSGFILVQAFGDVFGDCGIFRRRDRRTILLPDCVAVIMHGKIIGFERLLGL